MMKKTYKAPAMFVAVCGCDVVTASDCDESSVGWPGSQASTYGMKECPTPPDGGFGPIQ